MDYLTIQEIAMAARRNLSPNVWDYLSGGSDSETTLRRNRQSLDSLAFRPRVLVNVDNIDLGTNLLGQKLALPVFTAPIGSLALFDPNGALAVARAATGRGIFSFISTMSQPRIEDVAQAVDRPLVFQLYTRGDQDWVDDILARAKDSGYCAVCVTADTAYYGRRERDLINRFSPMSAVDRPNVAEMTAGQTIEAFMPALDWDELDRIRDYVGLPIVVKGIMTPEDAVLCVEHGVEVVYISNHGGRQLDHAQATIDVLPEVVAAVDGRADVIIDSGFVRGSDVLKAIALGAKAVGLGKFHAWALAAGGEAGLTRALEILEREMRVVMGLLGATSLADLKPERLRAAAPVTPPFATSAFPRFTDSFTP